MNKQNQLSLLFVGFMLLGVVLACQAPNSQNGSTNTAVQTNTASVVSSNAPAAKTSPAANTAMPNQPNATAGVTKANFDKIKNGMKYDDVVKILGKEGELVSESEVGGFKTVMYSWNGDEGWGANMNAMFQNGKLISKSQFGLK